MIKSFSFALFVCRAENVVIIYQYDYIIIIIIIIVVLVVAAAIIIITTIIIIINELYLFICLYLTRREPHWD